MKTVIDAKNKKLGRLASEIATILMGKDSPDFRRERLAKREVEVINVSEIQIDEKKQEQKKYKSFSGYPGGLKETPLKDVIAKKGYAEVLRTAVYGMLPKNKLRSQMIKNLVVKE